MVTEYVVLKEESLDDLANEVNALIADGWQPQGGIAVLREEFDSRGESQVYKWHFQAMVK
jgi:hypothetical protein